MDSLDDGTLMTCVKSLVQRGLGLYGQTEMAQICYNSGIALTDLNEIDWLEENHGKSVEKFLINYGTRNLPAKMTVIIMARKYRIPIPEVLTEQNRGKRRRRKIKNFFKK